MLGTSGASLALANSRFYINPSTNPPTTTWTHPNAKEGEPHPEQVADVQKAHSVATQYVEENPEAKAHAEERGLGSLLGSALGGSSRPSGMGMGGMGGMGGSGMGMAGAAGAGGLGGLLLGALMSVSPEGAEF